MGNCNNTNKGGNEFTNKIVKIYKVEYKGAIFRFL